MAFDALNAYKIMWILVFFDLPVTTKQDTRQATRFRKELLKDGFVMMQFSVYVRHCASKESMDVHIKRVKGLVPPKGHVSVLSITDKQYGDILNFWGAKEIPKERAPVQLELF